MLLASATMVCLKKVIDAQPESRLLPKIIAVLFVLPWVTEFRTITYGNSGLETSLYMLLLAIFILPSSVILSKRNLVLPWFLILIRPEGWLAGLAHAGNLVMDQKRKGIWLWMAAGFSSLIFWAWTGYVFFGTAIPQSILAKANHSIDRWVEIQKGFAYLLFADHPLALLVTISGYYFCPEIRKYFRLPVSWMILYLGFFSFLAAWWPWYLPPLFVPFWYLTMLSTLTLVNKIPELTALRNFSKSTIQISILVAVIGQGFWVCAENFDLIRKSSDAFVIRQTASRRVAGFIKTNIEPGKSLMLEPMGLIGFYSEKKEILDYPGLASPQVCSYLKGLQKKIPHRLTDPAINDSVLQKFHPAYLLIWREEKQAFSHSEYFQLHYRPMESFPYFLAEPRMDSVFLYQAIRN